MRSVVDQTKLDNEENAVTYVAAVYTQELEVKE